MKKVIALLAGLIVLAMSSAYGFEIKYHDVSDKSLQQMKYTVSFHTGAMLINDPSVLPEQIGAVYGDAKGIVKGSVFANDVTIYIPRIHVGVRGEMYGSAYCDYFSAYINTSDYSYDVSHNYGAKYDPHNWIIRFIDDKGNVIVEDVLYGEQSLYFYERTFDEGSYYSDVEFDIDGGYESVTYDPEKKRSFRQLIGMSDMTVNVVPEPSSLLALAFGGAGTALALRRRK